MSVNLSNNAERGRAFAHAASEAFRDEGHYFETLPDDAWNGPTGCAKWTLHDLAGHVVGEAVWFPSVVRTATEGSPPLPAEMWGQLKQLSGHEIGGRMVEAAQTLDEVIDGVTDDQMEMRFDLGWTKVPIWQAMFVALTEGSFHNWDAHAKREPNPTIPTPRAQMLARLLPWYAQNVAHKDAGRQATGRYLLQVRDGVGAVSVIVGDGTVEVKPETIDNPDVTLHLSADQYARLIAGRLPLRPAIERGEVKVDGENNRAEGLNLVFAGVGG